MSVEFLNTIFGVIVGSAITLFAQWIRERKNKKEDAYNTSVQIIFVLRPYIKDCIAVAKDHGMDLSNSDAENEPRKQNVKSPKYIQYPRNINWKSIKSKIMWDLLMLPLHAKKIEDNLDYFIKHESNDGLWIDITEQRQRNSRYGGVPTINSSSFFILPLT